MIAGLLRFLLLILAARFVFSLLVSLSKAPPRPSAGTPSSSGRLVRDPVCGVYVLRHRSLEDGGEHFCSSACRRVFREKREASA